MAFNTRSIYMQANLSNMMWLMYVVRLPIHTYLCIYIRVCYRKILTWTNNHILANKGTKKKNVSFLAIFMLCYGCYRRKRRKFLFLSTHSLIAYVRCCCRWCIREPASQKKSKERNALKTLYTYTCNAICSNNNNKNIFY